jgi:hypothetical protein
VLLWSNPGWAIGQRGFILNFTMNHWLFLLNYGSFPHQDLCQDTTKLYAWIIFEREFPELCILEIQPMMPPRYLVSGGLSMWSLQPNCSYGFWKWAENLFWLGGMFVRIPLELKAWSNDRKITTCFQIMKICSRTWFTSLINLVAGSNPIKS